MVRLLIAMVTVSGCLMISGCGGSDAPPVTVVMETTRGSIVIELNPAKAPVTVENFLAYAREGFYDNTVIHRTIPRFMIQGGGYDTFLKLKKTNAPIKNESSNGLLNERATIAMARTDDPNSATSQFYINLVDNRHLDKAGYAVFGRVVQGMEVVDAIAGLEILNMGGALTDIPRDPPVVAKVTIRE